MKRDWPSKAGMLLLRIALAPVIAVLIAAVGFAVAAAFVVHGEVKLRERGASDEA